MWPYVLVFLVPAILSLFARKQYAENVKTPIGNIGWVAFAITLALFIGWRWEVGADWSAYARYMRQAENSGLGEVLAGKDPGYQLINWIVASAGLGIVTVNLICGTIFAVALTRFCRILPLPWLGIAVAIPYAVTVVVMGYSRQGVALGLVLFALVALSERRVLHFVVWVVVATTFHKSAILLLPIAALSASQGRFWAVLWVGAFGVLGYWLLVHDSLDVLYSTYVEAQYQSEGAFIRVAMNLLPAAILLTKQKKFKFAPSERRLWKLFAWMSVGLFCLLLLTPASTAVDRVALYMLPLQFVVFSNLPVRFGSSVGGRFFITAAIIGFYASVLLVWLNYAGHADAWVPYRFFPFVEEY